MTEPLYIGIDIGGTKIASVLATRDGRTVATHHSWTNAADGAGAVIDRVADHVRTLSRDAGSAIRGIGIGCPGILDAPRGIIRRAVNLQWLDVALADELRQRIGDALPIRIEKDANAAAVGEVQFGAGKGCRDFALLTIGTGFGAGLIVDGQPVRGAAFAGGDLGHLSLDPSGRLCACGGVGCAETVLSGSGLLSLAQGRGSWKEPSDILTAARNGDETAKEIAVIASEWLGHVMSIVATMLDPARIALGGGLGSAGADLFLPIARQTMDRRMSPGLPRPTVVQSTLESSALGAAAVAIAADV